MKKEMKNKDNSISEQEDTFKETNDNKAEDIEINDSEVSDSSEQEEIKEDEVTPSLEEQLAKAQNDIKDYEDKYLRLMAEFDNYRRRVLKEKTELILNGGEKVITAILPILDDIERAEETMIANDDVDSMKEGVHLIFEKFKDILSKNGLSKLDSVGEPFNVDYHEAIAMVPGLPDEQRGKVIDCIEEGYKLNDKVIRHAKVAVAE